MGLHDRPYMQQGGGYHTPRRGIALGLPKPTPAVKVLLIINICVFVVQRFADRRGEVTYLFGVTVAEFWQLWRYLTFQFLHGGFIHLFFNMLGLYFLGSALERSWGTRRFLRFYLTCGVVAGLAYVVIGGLGGVGIPIIGASGGVFALLLVCAVMFPHFQIIVLLFPLPIRVVALIFFGGMVVKVLAAVSAGQVAVAMSDVAHLGGAGAAAVWLWVLPRLGGLRSATAGKPRGGAWQRKTQKHREAEADIDRILQKIHDQGLQSLSKKERKTLRQATRQQQEEEQNIYRP